MHIPFLQVNWEDGEQCVIGPEEKEEYKGLLMRIYAQKHILTHEIRGYIYIVM